MHKGSWRWARIDLEAGEHGSDVPGLPDPCIDWLSSVSAGDNQNLEMETTEEGKEAVWGSVIYYQDVEKRENKKVFQYILTHDLLVTDPIDFDRLYRLKGSEVMQKLDHAETAIEGFMILLGETVASFLKDIDGFENRMHDLLWQIKEQNNENVLERIMENRHEILVWKNLIIPIIEVKDAMLEAFGDEVSDGRNYTRTCRRINRCLEIIEQYDDEIRQMTDLETVLSSYRGNEIVKTLTVITLLFTPLAAWGALWGMNFEVMPELKWQFGYLFAILIIIATTAWLYVYLKQKNWIGDVLRSPKGRKF